MVFRPLGQICLLVVLKLICRGLLFKFVKLSALLQISLKRLESQAEFNINVGISHSRIFRPVEINANE